MRTETPGMRAWWQLLAFPVAPLIVFLQGVALFLPSLRVRVAAAVGGPLVVALLLLLVLTVGSGDTSGDRAFYGLISAFVLLTILLGASLLCTVLHVVRLVVDRASGPEEETRWAKRGIWASALSVLVGSTLLPLLLVTVPLAVVAAVLSWRRESTRLRYVAAGGAVLAVLVGALWAPTLVGIGGTEAGDVELDETERADCGARGSPVTLSELVEAFRRTGITLSVDADACRGTFEERRDRGLRDATNAGESGLDLPARVEAREGHVLCTVSDDFTGDGSVEVVKYETDTEWHLSRFNVSCSVYPSSPAAERAQVARLRRSLELLPPRIE